MIGQIFAAGFQIAGGALQRGEIIKATERRIEQMRLQAAQRVGQATAAAGASGVEMDSSTIQKHLEGMRLEYAKAVSQVSDAGGSAANNAMISAIGGAMGSIIKGMGDYADELDGTGGKPAQRQRDVNQATPWELDQGAGRLNDTLNWSWDR